MEPLVCIIILNWNGLQDTLECLKSLQDISYKNTKTIIVDNNSSNNEAAILREHCHQEIDIISNKNNYGYTGGNNVGIEYALNRYNPEYFLILNNDIVVAHDFLEQLISTADEFPMAGIIGAKIYYHRFPDLIQSAGGNIKYYLGKAQVIGNFVMDKGQYETSKTVDWVSGCCLLIKSSVIREIGLFDEQYFCYWDETDYCCRCWEAGYQVVYCGKAKIWHKVPVKMKLLEDSKSNFKPYTLYYGTRNNYLFMKKHANSFNYCTFFIYSLTINTIFITAICLLFHRDKKRLSGYLKGLYDGVFIKYEKKENVLFKKEYCIITN